MTYRVVEEIALGDGTGEILEVGTYLQEATLTGLDKSVMIANRIKNLPKNAFPIYDREQLEEFINDGKIVMF